jgi:hypothetical protein
MLRSGLSSDPEVPEVSSRPLPSLSPFFPCSPLPLSLPFRLYSLARLVRLSPLGPGGHFLQFLPGVVVQGGRPILTRKKMGMSTTGMDHLIPGSMEGL